MSFSAWIEFTDKGIALAPATAGVYCLRQDNVIIYFGRAQGADVTIRSRLQRHKAGDEGPCTKAATHFACEETTSPVTREKELLEDYKKKHGKLPRCNERVG